MGFFMRASSAGVIKPTIAAGVTLATAEETDSIVITNADSSNPAAVDLAFASSSVKATAFDQGTAQSPSYVLEAGTSRTVSLIRDTGANDYGDGNVIESVNARLPDGTLASQSLTVEPFVEITGSDSFGTFDAASSDYIYTPYNAAYDFSKTDAFSFSYWVNCTAGSFPTYSMPISHMDAGVGYESQWNNDNIVIMIGRPSDWIYLVYSTGTRTVDTWYHVASTYDGSNTIGGIKLYLDGTDVTSASTATGTSISGTITHSQPLTIGRRSDGLYYWDGEIDDVGLWSSVLNQTNVTALAGKTRAYRVAVASLVGYWDFDYVSGSLAGGIADMSGTAPTLDMVKG